MVLITGKPFTSDLGYRFSTGWDSPSVGDAEWEELLENLLVTLKVSIRVSTVESLISCIQKEGSPRPVSTRNQICPSESFIF